MVASDLATKKRVTFYPKVKGRSVRHLNEYTQKEKNAAWLTTEDNLRIKKDIKHTLDLILHGKALDGTECCRRGLEFRTPEGARIRQQNKTAAREAVLSEQTRQYDATGTCDPEILAKVYRACAYQSRVAAQMAGLSDMKIAQDLVENLSSSTTNDDGKKSSVSYVSAIMMQRHSKRRQKLAVAA